jgi:glycosyltransferase involved in cell wall biosynthesis
MIKEYNLEDRVIMCGMIRDIKFVERINSRSSLMLFPSLYDANSLVQIEAAAQGTPTVFLDGAKTASTVTNGVNGFIVKNDINAYADAIMDILSRPDYLKQVSEGAFRDLYITWDSVVDNVYNRYCDIMKRWQK